MDRPLENKTALITGSSRGIGRSIALLLASRGANIVLNFVRNEDAAVKTAEEIRKAGVRVLVCQANAGDPSALSAMVDQASAEFGGIDILVHNAALGAFKPVHKLKANQWDLSLEINSRAFLLLAQKTLPLMEARGGGSMIAISSLGSHRFIPNYGAIGISKAALEALVRYLAAELSPKGIRVNGVSGGLVDTDVLRFIPDSEAFQREVVSRTPMGRLGRPEDIARVVGFLVSPDAAWIAGQIIVADGGLSLI